MTWVIHIHKRIIKKINQLPEKLQLSLFALLKEIEISGPVRGNWKNYSKLGNTLHHCHLKTGNPTYVVIWEEVDQKINIVEVRYVGTHEKAPY